MTNLDNSSTPADADDADGADGADDANDANDAEEDHRSSLTMSTASERRRPPRSDSSSYRNRNSRKSYLLLPHGGYAIMVATLCTLAWMSSLFQDGCDYAQVTGPMVAQLATDSTNLPPWLELGLGAYREPTPPTENGGTWETTFDTPCIFYPDDFLVQDGAWTAARTFAFLALVVGGGGTLFVWCSTCFVFSRGTWRWTGYELLLASLCQAMGFSWFATQVCDWNTCKLFWGSAADIVASVLWGIGGLLVVCRYPVPRDRDVDVDADDEELDDGLEPAVTGVEEETQLTPSATAEMA